MGKPWAIVLLIVALVPGMGAPFVQTPSHALACHPVSLTAAMPWEDLDWEVRAPDLGFAAHGEGMAFSFRPCFPGIYTVSLCSGGRPVGKEEITVYPLPPDLLRPGDILYHPAVYSPLLQEPPKGLAFPLGHMGLVTCDFHVLEAHISGVRAVDTVAAFVARYRGDKVWVLRVSVPPPVRAKALEFAAAQIGKPYDPFFLTKSIFGRAYYCSELVWAAYQAGSGAERLENGDIRCGLVDLDPDDEGGCGPDPVSPEEILRSPWTKVVGYLVPPLEYRDGIPFLRGP